MSRNPCNYRNWKLMLPRRAATWKNNFISFAQYIAEQIAQYNTNWNGRIFVASDCFAIKQQHLFVYQLLPGYMIVFSLR